jgi:hypothetical protein
MREELTRERLLELLEFDETISRFRWKERPDSAWWTARYAGELAGCERQLGQVTYRKITLDSTPYLEHRLVWLYYYGHFPTKNIDHKDGDGLNNTKENLRLAPGNFNHKSMAKADNNTSGHTNVYWNKWAKKWEVKVRNNGTTHSGGYFKEEDLQLAIAKAKEMREAFGFSPTHGLTREERKAATSS